MEPIIIKVGHERINLSNFAWAQETVQTNGSPMVYVWMVGGGTYFTLYGDDAVAFLNRLDAIERSVKP